MVSFQNTSQAQATLVEHLGIPDDDLSGTIVGPFRMPMTGPFRKISSLLESS